MKVYYSVEVTKFLEKAREKDGARVNRTRELFEQWGFKVGPKYVKKISGDLWELRAGRIRLFLYVKREKAFGVHIIYKKSQKLKAQDIELAKRRSREL